MREASARQRRLAGAPQKHCNHAPEAPLYYGGAAPAKGPEFFAAN